MLKRLFDLVFAVTGLLLLSPLLLLLAIWVKLDSPGKVIFAQQRVGQFGNLFHLYKFRTMVPSSSAGRLGDEIAVTSVTDSRITRVGHYIRQYKLDELPQLVNVIIGDMSIVGPRPLMPKTLSWYPKEARDHILTVKPGITDPASVEFIDENAQFAGIEKNAMEAMYREKVIPRKVELVTHYIRNQSLAFDCKLIAQTLQKLALSMFVPRPQNRPDLQ